ncbi:MAG TPA: PH domain-containing protein [Candidatus Acidoferrum sp.]|nr:PH domain-containing protein [Candidatus Acidoferrum sp.]
MSPESSQWIGVGIAPIAVMVVLSFLLKNRRERARREGGSGVLVLEYGRAVKSVPILVAVAWTILIPIVLHDDPIRRENLPAFLLLVVLITVPLVVVTIEAFGVAHRIREDGIEKRSPWSSHRMIKWEDIREISFSGAMQWFVVSNPHGKLRLHLYLNGLKDFADAVRAKVPKETWAKAEAHLKNLDAKRPSPDTE